MTTIGGLPAHVLLVHLVVVILPLTSGFAILASIWPAAQRKLTFLIPAGALIGLIVVPITVSAGEAFAAQRGLEELVADHSAHGSRILPWVIALFVMTAGQWAYFQFARSRPRWLTVAIAVLVIAAAVGTTVQVVLTGDSGARAVWGGAA